MLKIVLRYILAVFIVSALIYASFLFIGAYQAMHTVNLMDYQAAISLKSALRECQHSVEINEPTEEDVKYYCNSFSGTGATLSSEYEDYLTYLYNYGSSATKTAAELLRNNLRDGVALVPSDFSLPFIQLSSTDISKRCKVQQVLPTDSKPTRYYDTDICSVIKKNLQLSTTAFNDGVCSLIEDSSDVPDIEVSLVDCNYKLYTLDEAKHLLGNVFESGGTDYDNLLYDKDEVLIYTIKVKIDYTLKINVPLLSAKVFNVPVAREYLDRYSLIN